MSSFVENTLMSDEKVILHTRPHLIIFASTFVWIIAGIILFMFGAKDNLGDIIIFEYPAHELLGALAFIFAIIQLVSTYIRYISYEFAVTNMRVLIKTGLIRRASSEIFLNKIESVNVRQGLMGRILNYGTLTISGTGGSKDSFNYAPEPLKFRRTIQEQVDTAHS